MHAQSLCHFLCQMLFLRFNWTILHHTRQEIKKSVSSNDKLTLFITIIMKYYSSIISSCPAGGASSTGCCSTGEVCNPGLVIGILSLISLCGTSAT